MRVLVALSGGVDSSVAALLLVRQGHEVVGLTMKNWCTGEGGGGARSCCSQESIDSAREVARKIGFPHYVADFEGLFAERVVEPFVRDYLEGRTPNPCVSCNARVRFPGLLQRASALGCEYFATGHYARLSSDNGRAELRRARDLAKDQSYVLWGVGEEELRRLLLPLGELRKPEVRRIAAGANLPTADRAESQEICFVPQGDYRAFLEKERSCGGSLPGTLREGEIVTTGGRRIGTHRGVARYTLGQRRGLGVALGRRGYVVGLDARANRVMVGEERDLYRTEAELREVRWPAGREKACSIEALVQLRSRHRAVQARVDRLGEGGARVRFAEPQRAVTPGQSAVFYEGDVVRGGGIVSDSPRRQEAGLTREGGIVHSFDPEEGWPSGRRRRS